ncbi:MAG TPA: LytR C-terminal domain-containing protein [Acidimicrobiales bacterium]|nr:LytR C-terminal domain-containing protein [Acidimicrobiales bacterium]
MTGVVDNEDHRPRHMARRRPDAADETDGEFDGAGGSTEAVAGHHGDGDAATAGSRRPPWPASRRARAAARRRVRSVAPGAAPGTVGAAPAEPAAAGAPAAAALAAPVVLPGVPGVGGGAEGLRRRRRLVLAAMAALFGGGVVLAVVGVNLVRNSTAGRYVAPTAGPDDPGYQAYVVPTPTMAVVQRSDDGDLVSVAVLAIESSDDGGGTVILVPASTQTRAKPAEPASGTSAATTATTGTAEGSSQPTLAEVYSQGGSEAVVAAVADLLAVAIPEHLEVDDARWASLVAPVAPVDLELAKRVGDWRAGDVSLAAEDVGPFLRARASGESEAERIDRQADFWTAWLTLVRDAGTDALPGEVDVGIGRFVRKLADGSPSIVPLPGEPTGGDAGTPESFVPHYQRVGELVVRAVPYPVSPSPGRRIRVRLLNGTTDPDLTGAAARRLVQGGAEITIVGNAPTFDETETLMLYERADQRNGAAWLAAGFGVGKVEQDPAAVGEAADDDEIDVTVILGADAPDLIGR